MRTILLGAAGLLALAACGEKSATPQAENPQAATPAEASAAETPADPQAESFPAPEPASLSEECGAVAADGYCGLRWGMSAEAASAAFPGGLVGGPQDGDEAGCFYMRRGDTDYGALFMFVDGALARIDVQSAEISTAAGAKAGMAFGAVEALYPGSVRQPNHYMAPVEDLIVDLGGGAFAVFEQEEGAVSRWRIGVKPAVDYVEGCS